MPTIGSELEGFLNSTKKVLLLCTNTPSSASRLMDSIAVQSWATSNHTAVPVFINLTAVTSPASTCIEETLLQHGLDLPTVLQAREERLSFFFLVTGFEDCGVFTNIFMRNHMYEWPGVKAIFSISQECQRNAPCINYYFLPCSRRSVHVQDSEAFEVIVIDGSDNCNDIGSPLPSGKYHIKFKCNICFRFSFFF